MTHIEYDYSHLEGEAKIDEALKDLKTWLGATRFNALRAAVKPFDENFPNSTGRMPTKEFLRDSLAMLAGVEGYPVEAFIERFCPNLPNGPGLTIVETTTTLEPIPQNLETQFQVATIIGERDKTAREAVRAETELQP